jgi:hypothetical protein
LTALCTLLLLCEKFLQLFEQLLKAPAAASTLAALTALGTSGAAALHIFNLILKVLDSLLGTLLPASDAANVACTTQTRNSVDTRHKS